MTPPDEDPKAGADAQKQKSETTGGGGNAASAPGTTEAVALLKADHRKVEGLFTEFQSADASRKNQIVQEACRELIVHTILEEEIFYPACREKASDVEPLIEAQVEHDGAKLLIMELMGRPDPEHRDALFKVLSEQIKHHVAEEEKPRDGIFAKAQAANLDMAELGRRITARKQELQARPGDLRPTRPRSMRILSQLADLGKEGTRPRNYGPERDERGRFTSDDDDRSGRYASERSSRSRDRDYDDDRRGHGGWSGDPRGHAEAAREGWSERRSYGGDRDYDDRDRDSRGRFISDEDRGYRSRGRDDDDDRSYRSRGRYEEDEGQGGWFGAPEGHSETSRRGWEERRGGRRMSSRDDDDGRYRSRGRYDEDEGQGGWFGDPEGHSEASRRGWEERRGERRTSSRDDEDRRYRSRSRDDDDDRRGSGQGGWFGDRRGHAEAARRGWENRR